MYSHITLGVNDIQKSINFYDGLMSILGYQRQHSSDDFAGYGDLKDAKIGNNFLWLLRPINGEPASAGNGTNIAFDASSRSIVDEFYKKAMELGGSDEGQPGIRPGAHENFYVAYVRDPDGNKLVCVCHAAE